MMMQRSCISSDMIGNGLLLLTLLLYWSLGVHVCAATEEGKAKLLGNATNTATHVLGSTSAQSLASILPVETWLLEPFPLPTATDATMELMISPLLPSERIADSASVPFATTSIMASAEPLVSIEIYSTSTLLLGTAVAEGSSLMLPQTQPSLLKATSSDAFSLHFVTTSIQMALIEPSPVLSLGSSSSLPDNVFTPSSFTSSSSPFSSQNSTSFSFFLSSSISTNKSQEVSPTPQQPMAVSSSELPGTAVPTMTHILQPSSSEPGVKSQPFTSFETIFPLTIPIPSPSRLMPFFPLSFSLDVSITTSSTQGSLPLGQHSATVPAFSGSDVLDLSSEVPFFMISNAASSSFHLVPTTVFDEPGITSQTELSQSLTIHLAYSTSTSLPVREQTSLLLGLSTPSTDMAPTSVEFLLPSLELLTSSEKLSSPSVTFTSESGLPDSDQSETILFLPTLSLSEQTFRSTSLPGTTHLPSQRELTLSLAASSTSPLYFPTEVASDLLIDESTAILEASDTIFPALSLTRDLFASSEVIPFSTAIFPTAVSQLLPSRTLPLQFSSIESSFKPSTTSVPHSAFPISTSTTLLSSSVLSTSTVVRTDTPLPSPSPVTSSFMILPSESSTTMSSAMTSSADSVIQIDMTDTFLLMPGETILQMPTTSVELTTTVYPSEPTTATEHTTRVTTDEPASSIATPTSELPFSLASDDIIPIVLPPSSLPGLPTLTMSITSIEPSQATSAAEFPLNSGTEQLLSTALEPLPSVVADSLALTLLPLPTPHFSPSPHVSPEASANMLSPPTSEVLPAKPTSLTQTPAQPLLSPSSPSERGGVLTSLQPVTMDTLSLLAPLSVSSAPTQASTVHSVPSSEHMFLPFSTYIMTGSTESTASFFSTTSSPVQETSLDVLFPEATSQASIAIPTPSVPESGPVPSEAQTDSLLLSSATGTFISPTLVPIPSESETETAFNTITFSEVFPSPFTSIFFTASFSLLQPEEPASLSQIPTQPLPSPSISSDIEGILTSIQPVQVETLSLMAPFSMTAAPTEASPAGPFQSSELVSSPLGTLAPSTEGIALMFPTTSLPVPETSIDVLFPEATSQIFIAIPTPTAFDSGALPSETSSSAFIPSSTTETFVSPTAVPAPSLSQTATAVHMFTIPEIFPSSLTSIFFTASSFLLQPEQSTSLTQTLTQPLLSPSSSSETEDIRTSILSSQMETLSLLLPLTLTAVPIETSIVHPLLSSEQVSSPLSILRASSEGILPSATSLPVLETSLDVLFPESTSQVFMAIPTPSLLDFESLSTEMPTDAIFPGSTMEILVSPTVVLSPSLFETEVLTPLVSELLLTPSLFISISTSTSILQQQLPNFTQPPPAETVSRLDPFTMTVAPTETTSIHSAPTVEISIVATETIALLSPASMSAVTHLSLSAFTLFTFTQPQPQPSTSFIRPLLSPFPSDTEVSLSTLPGLPMETSFLLPLFSTISAEPSSTRLMQSTEQTMPQFSTAARSTERPSSQISSEILTDILFPISTTAPEVSPVPSLSDSRTQFVSFISTTVSDLLLSPSPSPSTLLTTFLQPAPLLTTTQSPSPTSTPFETEKPFLIATESVTIPLTVTTVSIERSSPAPDQSTEQRSPQPATLTTLPSTTANSVVFSPETFTDILFPSAITDMSLPFTLLHTSSLIETNTSSTSIILLSTSEKVLPLSRSISIVTTTPIRTPPLSQTLPEISLTIDMHISSSPTREILSSSETPILSSARETPAVSPLTVVPTSVITSRVLQSETTPSMFTEISASLSGTTSQSISPTPTSAVRDIGTETETLSSSTPTSSLSSSHRIDASVDASMASAVMKATTTSSTSLPTPTPKPACTQYVLDKEPPYPYLLSIILAFTESEYNAIITPGSVERCSLENALTIIFKNGLMQLRGEQDMVKRETNVMHMDHGRQKKLQNGQHLLTKDDFLSLQKRQTVAEHYIAVISDVSTLDSGVAEVIFYILNLTSIPVPVPASTAETAFGRIQVSHVDSYPVIREVAIVESFRSEVCVPCIAGGVVGGVVLLLIVPAVIAVVIVLIFWKRKQRGQYPVEDSSTVRDNRSAERNNTFETTDPLYFESRPVESSHSTSSESSRQEERRGVTMAELAHSSSHVSWESNDTPDANLLPATLFERVAYFATPVPSPHVRPLQARLRQPSSLTPPRTQSPSKTDERALDKSSSDDEVKPKDTKKMKTGVSSQKVLREVRRQQKDEENQELWERKRATLERFKQTSKHSHTSRSGTRMYSHQHKEKLASTKQPSTFGGRLLYSEEGESRLLENGDEGDTDAESPPSATPLSDLPASIRDSTHKRVKVRKRRSRISPKLSTSDDEGLTGQHARQQQWTHTHKFKLGRSQRVQPMPLLATSGRQSRAIAQCVHREFAWMDPPQGVQLMSIQSVQPILQPQSLRPPPPHYMLPPQLSLPSPPTGHHSPTPTPDYTLLSSTNRQMHAHHATAPTPHSASTQHIVRDVGSDEEGGAVLSGVDSVDGGVVRVKPGSHLLKSEGDLTRECSITGGGGKSRVGGNNRSITKQPPVTEQPKSVTSEKHASHPAATDDGEGGTKGETHPPLRDSEHPHREEDSGLSLQGMLQQAFQIQPQQGRKQKVHIHLKEENVRMPEQPYYGAWQTQSTTQEQVLQTSGPPHHRHPHYTLDSTPEGKATPQGELIWNPDSSAVEPVMPMLTATQLTHLRSGSRADHYDLTVPFDDHPQTWGKPLLTPQYTSTPRPPKTRRWHDSTDK